MQDEWVLVFQEGGFQVPDFLNDKKFDTICFYFPENNSAHQGLINISADVDLYPESTECENVKLFNR